MYPTDFASSVISSLFIDHIVALKNLHLSDFPLIQIQTGHSAHRDTSCLGDSFIRNKFYSGFIPDDLHNE